MSRPCLPHVRRSALWAAGLVLMAAAGRGERLDDPALVRDPALVGDPVLAGDPIDRRTGQTAEIVPGAPWLRVVPGRKRVRVDRRWIGDADLVVRTGDAAVLPAAEDRRRGVPPAMAVAGAFGEGEPVTLSVFPLDARGDAAFPDYFQDHPVLLLGFADLDGDGYVGVTHLDGDRGDDFIERAELVPTGLRYALGHDGVARGVLSMPVGGPVATPARVVLAAAFMAGPRAADHFDAILPRGPVVMSRLPFLPATDPSGLLRPSPRAPVPADPRGRVGVWVRPAYTPDPRDRRIREAFTLSVAGDEATTAAVHVTSGAFVRFGLVRTPDPDHYRPLVARPLRPGVDDQGRRVPVEILRRLAVPDDGNASRTELRVVALDLLGNVTEPESSQAVEISTGGTLRIVHPDRDGDPWRETVWVSDARGARVVVDDPGGAWDDPDRDMLLVEGAGALARVDVWMADPDVDDSGVVTRDDERAVRERLDVALGDPRYEARFDVDGNGVIEREDLVHVRRHRRERVPIP